MRTFPVEIENHLSARRGLRVHALLWITAQNRSSGAKEGLGLWTGLDTIDLVIEGQTRRYYGAGGLLGFEALQSSSEMLERTWSLQISGLHEAAVAAIREYNARLAPVELHSWWHDPDTDRPLADPVREFRGHVMEVSLPTPEPGGESAADLRCVSDAWRLTRGLTLKRSHSALRKRAPDDRFRMNNTTSGTAQVPWGEEMKGYDSVSVWRTIGGLVLRR